MNLRWNIDNIYSEINELRIQFHNTTDENKRCILCRDIYAYTLLLESADFSPLNLNDSDLIKCKNIYEQNFEDEKNKLIEIIYSRYDKFSSLINNVNNMDVNIDNPIPKNNFIIDSKSLNYLKNFLEQFDEKLSNYFEYIYNNSYININTIHSKQSDFYEGCCTNMHTNKKSYIEVMLSSPYYILPILAHEYGHAYENLIPKNDNSWIYNTNIYIEVFATFLGLTFGDFIMCTNYYNQGKYYIFDLVKTIFILANKLKKYFGDAKLDNYNTLTDFIYLYDTNIALAFLEQYKIDKKSCKKNVEYFIRNNDVAFSDNLLKSVDIDLKRLYSGDYYKDFCERQKRLIK